MSKKEPEKKLVRIAVIIDETGETECSMMTGNEEVDIKRRRELPDWVDGDHRKLYMVEAYIPIPYGAPACIGGSVTEVENG